MSVTSFQSCEGALPATAKVEVGADGVFNKLFEVGHDMIKSANTVGGSVKPMAAAEEEEAAEPAEIDWESCSYFKGKDGQSQLALCWRDYVAWNHKIFGRVVQTNLVMVSADEKSRMELLQVLIISYHCIQVNTGKVGVCNVTLEIENLEEELGDHYPEWVDSEGEDVFPSFPGYVAPGQITNVGATVPKNKGLPEVGIVPDFKACEAPPIPPVTARAHKCTEVAKEGGKVKFCTYKRLKEWVPYEGERTVMVEGYMINSGTTTVCDIEVSIENFENNEAFWGEW